VWTEDKLLFNAAIRKFGSWEKALRAAGLQPKPRRKWSKERVITGLQIWHDQAEKDIRRFDAGLAGAAARLFGTLGNAMEAAGVEPKNRRWTDRRVIEAIQDRYVQGLPINVPGFGDKPLAGAARRRFGSWPEALAVAGLSDKYREPLPAPTWTPEDVLEAIRAWDEQGRRITNICRQDYQLYSVARKHFGGWQAAVIAAGLEPTRKQWTKQSVIEAIRARHQRGQSLNSGIVFKQDAPLAGAGSRLFGTWRKAVAAAGLKQVSGEIPNQRKVA
jgi:hypothetical protein